MGRRGTAYFARIFAVVLILACIFLVRSIVAIPSYIRLLPGQEHLFRLVAPLTLTHVSGGHKDFVTTAGRGGVSVRPTQLGRMNLQLSLFGLFPLKNVVVDVVSETHVIPGGQAIGVLLSSSGLIVTKTFPVTDINGNERYPAQAAGLRPGDVIVKINGIEVTDPHQVSVLVSNFAEKGREIWLDVRRGREMLRMQIQPVQVDRRQGSALYGPSYLLGVLLEEPTAGVGTLTFYDPVSHRFGALGHRITDRENRTVTVEDGRIVRAYIDGIQIGARGQPGEKLGRFEGKRDEVGIITKNTDYGIYGTITKPNFVQGRTMPVALSREVKPGHAQIRTVISGYTVETFDIEILKVMQQSRPEGKGLIIRITDPRLLRETGGIVQGMSGSPIIQNGKLVGAVTHVFINEPTKGYGILAEWMVYEAGIGSENKDTRSTATGISAA